MLDDVISRLRGAVENGHAIGLTVDEIEELLQALDQKVKVEEPITFEEAVFALTAVLSEFGSPKPVNSMTWNGILAQMKSWMDDPSLIDYDGIDPPNQKSYRAAVAGVEKLEALRCPQPWVVPAANGGFVFDLSFDDRDDKRCAYASFEFDLAGRSLFALLKQGKVLKCTELI